MINKLEKRFLLFLSVEIIAVSHLVSGFFRILADVLLLITIIFILYVRP